MGGRMAFWYAGSASALLVVATSSIYGMVSSGLDAESDRYLGYSIDYMKDKHLGDVATAAEAEWMADAESPDGDYRIRADDGRVLFETPQAKLRLPPDLQPDVPGVDYSTSTGKRFRALARRHAGRTYEASYDRTREMELLARIRRYMMLVLIPALAASTLAGVFIARQGLRPLGEITATARRIGPERLGERIAADRLPSELSELARTFNVMLDRLQASFGRLERFSGDMAHELRTPVHSIRTVAEVALATSRTRAEDREALEACLDSAARLAHLIERLLFLARAEDPRMLLELETLDMAAELAALCEFYGPAAADKGVELALSVPEQLSCRLDRTLFQRALGNLLINALTYTPKGGRVTISACEDEGVLVSVSETGVGVDPEHLPRLFERLFRSDPSRQADQGVGLGLAIVRSIVELHRGSASAANRPGGGSVFTLRFPPNLPEDVISF